MKTTIAYHPGFNDFYVDAKKMELNVERTVMAGLEGISLGAEDTLVNITYRVDVPVKIVVASTVLLACITKRFPKFRPKAMLIHSVPSPALAIDIEFGSFRDIGRAFV